MFPDVVPAGQGALEGGIVGMILPKPEVAHHGLGLDPPLTGVVKGTVQKLLIAHGAVGQQALVAGAAHGQRPGTHAVHHVGVAKGEGALHGQPGGLDVVAVGKAAGQHAPVPFEIQLQVARGRHHTRADDIQESLHGLLERRIGPHLVQVGIGLQDVQVGVHRLVGIDVVGR